LNYYLTSTQLENITAYNNTGDGVKIYDYAEKNDFDNITSYENDGDGVEVHNNSDNNIFTNIDLYDNDKDGIVLHAFSNTNYFENATSYNNTGNGIEIHDFTDDNTIKNFMSYNNTEDDFFLWNTSLNNTILDSTYSNRTISLNDSTSEIILKTTTNKIAYYSDTTVSQTISPTNVTTTIAPTVDDYVTTVDTKDDFTVATDSGTLNLRLASYVAGGRANFNVSSAIPTLVSTFILGGYHIGQPVEFKRDDVTVACIRANISGVVTYIYTGGFSEHEFEVDAVDPYVYLNDTTNFSITRDSYDAAAYTAQVTITHIGTENNTCAVSIEMPLIGDSAYTKLGYNITNITAGFTVTDHSGWAAMNFTITENTTIRIMPSEAAKPSNLPLVVGGGIGVVTVIVFLYRRRRR
ncbi:MAG: right-handed parallel beta-helix repeat-containing protein, partial [candidate division Zixibacteria bacterium]|nr:right-handed parallel beta-helix repeat-containing protein [candidate division Zixibacteria bacterium]